MIFNNLLKITKLNIFFFTIMLENVVTFSCNDKIIDSASKLASSDSKFSMYLLNL